MSFLFLALFLSAPASAGCDPCICGGPDAEICVGPKSTPTGIPLNTAWKREVYVFAQKNVVHPAWGIAHSERDYQVTKSLAERGGFALDEDVLFVSAFLHDLGGLPAFEKKGVDHAVRSVELIEPLLAHWGFPMEKWLAVKEMILGHTYYGPVPSSRPALAFRDADILDFLGAIGVARILAVTFESGTTLAPSVAWLKDFANSPAEKCGLNACKEIAGRRRAETLRFLDELNRESFNEKAL